MTVLGLAFEELEDADFFEFLEDFDVSYPILKVDVYEPPEPFGAPKVLPTTIILDPRAGRYESLSGAGHARGHRERSYDSTGNKAL